MIKSSCQVGKMLYVIPTFGAGWGGILANRSPHRNIPTPGPHPAPHTSLPLTPASHPGKQILTTFDCNDIWNVRSGRFNSRKITRSLRSPHSHGELRLA